MSTRTLHLYVIIGRTLLTVRTFFHHPSSLLPKPARVLLLWGPLILILRLPNYWYAVVLRPPSPVKETMRHDLEGPNLVSAGVLLPIVQNDNNDTSSSSDSEEDNESPLTLVQRRHMHSLYLANVPASNKFMRKKITLKGLSNKQKTAIKVAAATLTKEQRKKFIKQHEVVENA